MALILKGAGFDRRYDEDAYVMIRTAIVRRCEVMDSQRKPAKHFELQVHYQHRHMLDGQKGAPESEHTATIKLTQEQADILMAPIYERLAELIGGDADHAPRTPVSVSPPEPAPEPPQEAALLSEEVVEADAQPQAPDLNVIPERLAKYAQADETAADFRARLKLLWQRFGIADGQHFPGGGEPLSGDEKINMREIDIVLNSDDGKANGLLDWLLAEER